MNLESSWVRAGLLSPVLLVIAAGAVLSSNRELAHLAMWSVSETASHAPFAAPPAPRAPGTPGLEPAVHDFERARFIASQILTRCASPSRPSVVRWSSFDEMWRQIRSGAVADCWPRSLLFVSDATRAGLAARVWALETDRFRGQAHSVPEVYLRDEGRWVLFDVTLNACALDSSGAPLGLLELRDRILEGRQGSFQFAPLAPETYVAPATGPYYADRCRDVFLRRNLGLDDRDRYGPLAPFARQLDLLPEGAKKGLSAAFGRTGSVLHYHDTHNASLADAAIAARFGLLLVPSVAALWVVLLTVAYMGYAAIYTLYSLPPRGRWSFVQSFESGDLRAFARPGSIQAGSRHAATVVTSPARGGGHALHVRLGPDDRPVRGNHRAELRLRPTRLGSTNEYAFGVLVPSGWTERESETVIAQWHSVPDRWRGKAHVPAPLALGIAAGRWILWTTADAHALARGQFGSGAGRQRAALLDLPVDTDRWVDWWFTIRWSFDASGMLIVRKDAIEVARRPGPNTHHDSIGPYFKFGLYAPGGPTPGLTRTIYFDALRVQQGLGDATT